MRPLHSLFAAAAALAALTVSCGSAPASRGPSADLWLEGRLTAPKTPLEYRIDGLQPGAAYRLDIFDRFHVSERGGEDASTKSVVLRLDGGAGEGYAGTHDGVHYSDDPGGIVIRALEAGFLLRVETGKAEGLGLFRARLRRVSGEVLARALMRYSTYEGVPSILKGTKAGPAPAAARGSVYLHGSSIVPAARDLQGAEAAGRDQIFLTGEEGRFVELPLVASTESLAVDSPERALSPYAARRVRDAAALLFDGGDQSVYVRAWKGSPLPAAIDAAVRGRGASVGGNSAGLAILGEYLYAALHDEDLGSGQALADPFGPLLTIETGFLHVPGLEGAITESHYSERGRQGRLVAFLARLLADGRARIDLLYGIGVDEGCCLVLDGQGKARVFGVGAAWILVPRGLPDRCEPGKTLDWRSGGVDAIKLPASPAGSTSWDWRSIRALPPEARYLVEDGVLRRLP